MHQQKVNLLGLFLLISFLPESGEKLLQDAELVESNEIFHSCRRDERVDERCCIAGRWIIGE